MKLSVIDLFIIASYLGLDNPDKTFLTMLRVSMPIGMMGLMNLFPVSTWTHFMTLSFLPFLFCAALRVGVSLVTRHSPASRAWKMPKRERSPMQPGGVPASWPGGCGPCWRL